MARNLLRAIPLFQPLEERVLLAATVFDVWYGDTQEFGTLGNPQRCINILGNVSDGDGMASLKFRLNGGAYQALSIGSDGRRLENAGDFNVEIDRANLLEGDNTVILHAQDSPGNVTYHTVNVHYTGGSEWPLPYTVDWTRQTSVTRAAQVVDGLWGIQNGMLRTLQPGYDRVVALGSIDWQDCEVTVPFVAHNKGGGIGIVLRWQGHWAWNSDQPSWGWAPSGADAWFYWPNGTGQLKIEGDSGDLAKVNIPVNVEENFTIKIRCDTVGPDRSLYKVKMWRTGQPEPAAWTLTAYDNPGNLENGSVILVAHEVDVSFGNVTITGPYGRGDFNHDGAVTATDIDLLCANLGGGAQYDLTGDGVVNRADMDELVGGVLNTYYGDANLDGEVNFLDFQVLLDNWQQTATWAGGDFTGDGACDFLDFQRMLDHWSPAASASATSASAELPAVGNAMIATAAATGSTNMMATQGGLPHMEGWARADFTDNNAPANLRLAPNYPAPWTAMSVRNLPAMKELAGVMPTPPALHLLSYRYERHAQKQEFRYELQRPAASVSVRLGPILADVRVASATHNGRNVPLECVESGDSRWIWLRDISKQAGDIERTWA